MKAGLRALALPLPLLLALALAVALLLLACLPARAASYAFTTAQCVSGRAFGAPGQTCAAFPTQAAVAGSAATAWVTMLAGGVPNAPATTTTVRLSFALGCINPASHAGVAASYAGLTLPLCSDHGTAPTRTSGWSAPVDLTFRAGAASATMSVPTFSYADVGQVTLMLRDASGATASSAAFVVKPARTAITAVTRNADGAVMPTVATGADSGFTRVGEAFTIRAAALTSSGAVAPNFGSEGALLRLDVQLPADAATRSAMRKLPTLGATSFALVAGGVFSRSDFAADELGIVAVTPQLASGDYLGAGSVPASARNVGRFYPDHFDTVTSGAMACLAHMQCPPGVTTAAYAGQAFGVTVKPMAASGAELLNYSGVLARAITLSAWSAAGGGSANPGAGALSANSIAAGASLAATPSYSLPNPFSDSAPRANNWSVPTAIWLRASASENVGAASVVVSSMQPPPALSSEGALEIVAGRLSLGNPYGSELLTLPVHLEAQYWTAARRWETTSVDNASSVLPSTISFSSCLKNLGSPCKTAVLAAVNTASVALVAGMGTFWLKAPGAGNTGSAQFKLGSPAWLPSTGGRAVFGVFSSPLIYSREVY